MGPTHRRWAGGLALALAVSLSASACSSGGSDPVADPVDADRAVARAVTEEPPTSAESPASNEPAALNDPGLNPEGVINAAVVLWSDGDVDAAFAAGAFTRDELDAARAGLADGSLAYLFE